MSSNSALSNIDSKSTALVVLDVQPLIMSMIEGSEERLDSILKIIDAGQKRNCLTIYIRVAFTHKEWADLSPNVKNFHAMKMKTGNTDTAPDYIHVDSDATALHPQIQERIGKGNHLILRKSRFGPFSNPSLLEELQKRGIKTLILMGFKTSGAVLSTVRVAADHDFNIVVVRDAVLDPDPQLDEVLLDKIIPEQAHVVTLAEIESALSLK